MQVTPFCVFVSGVSLDDMQLRRWISSSDLDDLGSYSFNLIRANEIGASACHTIKMHQDGQFVGEAYYSGRLFIDQ